jgi:O-antigen polymerase
MIWPNQLPSVEAFGWILTLTSLSVYMLQWQIEKHMPHLLQRERNENFISEVVIEGLTAQQKLLVLTLILASVMSAFVTVAQFYGHDQLHSRIAHGILGQRNLQATLSTIGVLAICLLAGNKVTESTQLAWFKLILFLTPLCLLSISAAISQSRTATIQWFLIALTLFLLRRKLLRTCRLLATIALVIFCVTLIAQEVTSINMANFHQTVFNRWSDANAYTRTALWTNAWLLMLDQPFLGHGWRSLAFMHYTTEFSSERFMEMLDNAHNLPLHLAVELGMPVALLFCSVVVWLIWKNKPWAETLPERQLAWGILMVIGIHSMVEYPLWYGPFFMTTVIAVGILCADGWRAWLLAQTQDAQRTVLWGIRGFAVLLLAGTAFAAFDYHRVSQIYLQPEERSAWYKADPLGAAKKSVLFQNHAKFAELQITPLTRETAPRVLALSSELVMWSPEPRIIEKLIESAVMMQIDDLAAFHIKRYKIAYPQAYALWSDRSR